MKIVHLTDPHLTLPGLRLGGRDPHANLARALGEIAELHGDADLLAITGDLSDRGAVEDYRRLEALLAALPMPVALTIGNHDDRAAFLEVFPAHGDGAGFAQARIELSAGTALLLDTVAPGRHAGVYCAGRRAWLETELARGPGPYFLFLHHNPVPTHLPPLDRIMLEDWEAFADLVARHRDRIAHIFHGHCHLPMAGSLAGVPVTSGRGTAQAGFPSYGAAELLELSDLPEAYSVAIVGPRATTVMMVEFTRRPAAR